MKNDWESTVRQNDNLYIYIILSIAYYVVNVLFACNDVTYLIFRICIKVTNTYAVSIVITSNHLANQKT